MVLKNIIKIILEPLYLYKMVVAEKIRKKKMFYRYRKPIELQFPITYKCNFDCVMCGMHSLINKKHMSAEEISNVLADKLYQDVQSVGINGGEPFLRLDLIECIGNIVNTLPKLRTINIISNGYCTKKIINDLKVIKKICTEAKVKLQVSFSLDGIEEMQGFMRGKEDAYDKLVNTIQLIKDNRDMYCDSLMMICTVTKYNIYKIYEVEKWSKEYNIEVSYNVATINKRIANEDRVNDFSVFGDEQARMLTQEFFYKKYLETGSEKYYGLFLFLHEGKRYGYCPYEYKEGVTLTPSGEVCYCATHSEIMGNALKESSYNIFVDNENYHRDLCNKHCSTCSHYFYSLNSLGKKKLKKEIDNMRKLVLLPKLRRK